jgi:hypothetical protein
MIRVRNGFEAVSLVIYMVIVFVYAYATYFIHSFYHIQVIQYQSLPEVAAVSAMGLRTS